MISTTRRTFLGGVLALSVSPALPALAQPVPRIVGDGIHDDTAGLQSLLDGLPFQCENDSFVARSGTITGGTFRITDTLFLRRQAIIIRDCVFYADGIEDSMYAIFSRGPAI